MEVRVLVAFFTLLLLLPPPGRAFAKTSPSVVDVGGYLQGRTARVRFVLKDAFTPEMVEALKSGVEIVFRVTVEVERVHRNWFDVTVGTLQFTQSIRYDVLARVYRLHREATDEMLPGIHEALDRMTHYDETIPLSAPATPGKPYRASVRARVDRVGLAEPLRSIVFFSSLWDVETDWARGFLQAR